MPTETPQHLVVFIRLLVSQFDLQGANMSTRHVVPESHAVRRVLWVNHGAQQSSNFAFLAFISLWIKEIAISYCDRRTALGIATSFHFLCLPKKPWPPLIILLSFHAGGSRLTTKRVRGHWFGSSGKASVLWGEGHKKDEGDVTALLWRKPERVHPGEEKVPGRPYCSISVLKGGL